MEGNVAVEVGIADVVTMGLLVGFPSWGLGVATIMVIISCIISLDPDSAARCMGLMPLTSAMVVEAPRSMSCFTTSA